MAKNHRLDFTTQLLLYILGISALLRFIDLLIFVFIGYNLTIAYTTPVYLIGVSIISLGWIVNSFGLIWLKKWAWWGLPLTTYFTLTLSCLYFERTFLSFAIGFVLLSLMLLPILYNAKPLVFDENI